MYMEYGGRSVQMINFITRSFVFLVFPFCNLVWSTTVSTGSYDNHRTGANTTETILTQSNAGAVRLVCTLTTDGDISGQPLVVTSSLITGVSHIGITATWANTLYAFNADTCASIWSFSTG